MSKTTEITHFRTDKFVMTAGELIDALKQKYGEDQAFGNRLSAVEAKSYYGVRRSRYWVFGQAGWVFSSCYQSDVGGSTD